MNLIHLYSTLILFSVFIIKPYDYRINNYMNDSENNSYPGNFSIIIENEDYQNYSCAISCFKNSLFGSDTFILYGKSFHNLKFNCAYNIGYIMITPIGSTKYDIWEVKPYKKCYIRNGLVFQEK